MADSTPKSYTTDPTLYLYTSLSSGSSHIVTATSRLETILKANKISFRALDVATDEKARMLWGRRAGKRKLPGLVRMGMVVGDLDEVEEWNEYGEITEQLGSSAPAPAPVSTPSASAMNTPSKPSATARPAAKTPAPSGAAPVTPISKTDTTAAEKPKPPPSSVDSSVALAMRQASTEAAAQAKKAKSKPQATPTPALADEAEGIASGSPALDEQKAATLDNSTLSGTSPPSVTAEAKEAIAPETSGSMPEPTAEEVSSKSSAKAAASAEAPGADSTPPTVTVTGDSRADAQALSRSAPAVPEEALTMSTSAADSASLGATSTSHRASSFSPASDEEIYEIESATKIQEDPEAEAAESAPAQESGVSKKDSEQHVKFKGEEPGTEMNRVKATLSAGGRKPERDLKAAHAVSQTEERPGSSGEGADVAEEKTSVTEQKPTAEASNKPSETEAVETAAGDSTTAANSNTD